MSETLIPTMGLRVKIVLIKNGKFGPSVSEPVPVLQQRFETLNGRAIWRNVEIVGPDTPDRE